MCILSDPAETALYRSVSETRQELPPLFFRVTFGADAYRDAVRFFVDATAICKRLRSSISRATGTSGGSGSLMTVSQRRFRLR